MIINQLAVNHAGFNWKNLIPVSISPWSGARLGLARSGFRFPSRTF